MEKKKQIFQYCCSFFFFFFADNKTRSRAKRSRTHSRCFPERFPQVVRQRSAHNGKFNRDNITIHNDNNNNNIKLYFIFL